MKIKENGYMKVKQIKLKLVVLKVTIVNLKSPVPSPHVSASSVVTPALKSKPFSWLQAALT